MAYWRAGTRVFRREGPGQFSPKIRLCLYLGWL